MGFGNFQPIFRLERSLYELNDDILFTIKIDNMKKDSYFYHVFFWSKICDFQSFSRNKLNLHIWSLTLFYLVTCVVCIHLVWLFLDLVGFDILVMLRIDVYLFSSPI